MTEEKIQEEQNQPELVKARPEILPKPTYAPFLLAVSLLFICWGMLSIWIFSVAGLIGAGISLYAWIKELLYERKNES